MRPNIPDFTQAEIDKFIRECNFTENERKLFDLRNAGMKLDDCAEAMNYSVSQIKRINKKMKNKIIKVL